MGDLAALMSINRTFWNRRRTFLTGHTGFKGGWLATWLLDLEAQVSGYSLPPATEGSYFTLCNLDRRIESVFSNILDVDVLSTAMYRSRPQIVFHLAAQPLVRRSYRQPVETFATNVMGTLNLLEAVRKTPSVKAVVVITSDKCYENRELIRGYRESDPLGGHDPYSASKGCAELITSSYQRSFFQSGDLRVSAATARAGNVFGGGDTAEDRLVPDAVRALRSGEPLMVRNPPSVRPWQHVMEPLAGYLMLAERLYTEGNRWAGAWNFGPGDDGALPVSALADSLIKHWGEGSWRAAEEVNAPHETCYLKLDCDKARRLLGWKPVLSLDQAVALTMRWYRQASTNAGEDMFNYSREQIHDYGQLAAQSK
jgi:CDP-glucose 4,6-dehydratase